MMVFGLAFFIYGIFFTNNVYLRTCMVVYAVWVFWVDRKRCDGVGYPSEHQFPFNVLRHWVRNNFLYGIHCAYYPIKLHKTAELPIKDKHNNKQKYLFTCHPHGVIGVGTMSVFGSDEVGFSKLFPGIDPYLTGLRQAFSVPFFRDWCLLGGILSADKSSFRHIFEMKQESAVINLGGAAEAFISMEANPETGNPVMKFLLKDRKGFCKLALQHGVSLVPVISFEEHLLFDLVQLPACAHRVQLYLQKHVFGFAPVMVWGNKWPFMPKRHELNVFVGRPIPCTKNVNPTSMDIDDKHREYCQELEFMFHECKKLVEGCENWELQLVEHPIKNVK